MRRRLLGLAAFASCGLLMTMASALLAACFARPGYAAVEAHSGEDLDWASPYLFDRSSAWLLLRETFPGLSREWCREQTPYLSHKPWSAPPASPISQAKEGAALVEDLVLKQWANADACDVAQNLRDLLEVANAERVSAGWPFPAFRGCLVRRYLRGDVGCCVCPPRTEPLERHAMLPITARLGARTINAELPVRPVWVGIALDTVVYGAALWLLVRSLGALRRGIRSRRGLCPGCAYPAGVSPLCTECGTALRPWAARTPPAA